MYHSATTPMIPPSTATTWLGPLLLLAGVLLLASLSLYQRLRQTLTESAACRAKLDALSPPEPIHFYHSDQPYYQFTNFWPAPIYRRGRRFACSETYFQAAKFQGNLRAAARVAACSEPREAYDLARQLMHKEGVPSRADWRKGGNVQAMTQALEAKFVQHPELATLLLDTGDATLVNRSPASDLFWGDGSNGSPGTARGMNMLGRLLLRVRQRLRDGTLVPVADAGHRVCRWCGIRERDCGDNGNVLEHCVDDECAALTEACMDVEDDEDDQTLAGVQGFTAALMSGMADFEGPIQSATNAAKKALRRRRHRGSQHHQRKHDLGIGAGAGAGAGAGSPRPAPASTCNNCGVTERDGWTVTGDYCSNECMHATAQQTNALCMFCAGRCGPHVRLCSTACHAAACENCHCRIKEPTFRCCSARCHSAAVGAAAT